MLCKASKFFFQALYQVKISSWQTVNCLLFFWYTRYQKNIIYENISYQWARRQERMANIVTSCRIMGSILLLFFPAFSFWFYILYLICGFSDMIDGMIDRKTNTVNEFGSRLDTIADFIFMTACLVKLLPAIPIPSWLWWWVAGIAVIKIMNVVSRFVYQKNFVVKHTIMNKITGLLLFSLSLTLSLIEFKYSTIVICCIATFAAIQEGHLIRTERAIGEWNFSLINLLSERLLHILFADRSLKKLDAKENKHPYDLTIRVLHYFVHTDMLGGFIFRVPPLPFQPVPRKQPYHWQQALPASCDWDQCQHAWDRS